MTFSPKKIISAELFHSSVACLNMGLILNEIRGFLTANFNKNEAETYKKENETDTVYRYSHQTVFF